VCAACRQCFTLLPHWLLPFKRYTATEIEAVLRHVFKGHHLADAPSGAEESTLRRWWREFRPQIRDWGGLLEARLWRLYQRLESLIRLPVNPLQRLQKVVETLPALPAHWTLLVKTLWWLQKSHPHCLG
jgi:hypothetical protein